MKLPRKVRHDNHKFTRNVHRLAAYCLERIQNAASPMSSVWCDGRTLVVFPVPSKSHERRAERGAEELVGVYDQYVTIEQLYFDLEEQL